MFGACFPFSKYSKRAYIKSFEGGGLGGPTIIYAEFLCVLFFFAADWLLAWPPLQNVAVIFFKYFRKFWR